MTLHDQFQERMRQLGCAEEADDQEVWTQVSAHGLVHVALDGRGFRVVGTYHPASSINDALACRRIFSSLVP